MVNVKIPLKSEGGVHGPLNRWMIFPWRVHHQGMTIIITMMKPQDKRMQAIVVCPSPPLPTSSSSSMVRVTRGRSNIMAICCVVILIHCELTLGMNLWRIHSVHKVIIVFSH